MAGKLARPHEHWIKRMHYDCGRGTFSIQKRIYYDNNWVHFFLNVRTSANLQIVFEQW